MAETSNVIDLASRKPIKTEWHESKKILVGKRSDGYLCLQALQPLLNKGWSVHIAKARHNAVIVHILDSEGKIFKSGEGTSFSVAIRRGTEGLSKVFDHMRE